MTLRTSPFLNAHKEEILHLIRNEEEWAKGFNPLERIIEIIESNEGIVVTTTKHYPSGIQGGKSDRSRLCSAAQTEETGGSR